MNRREALNRVAWLMGGTLSVPTLIACSEQKAETAATTAAAFVLTDAQRKIVASVAEHIIPKTSTAGAIEAGVPAFIEMMLKDCYKAPEHQSFSEGVVALEKAGFATQTPEQQVATLTKLQADTNELMKEMAVKKEKVGDNVDKESIDKKDKGIPYWRLMKELTLLGYFTSKEGITQNFDYQTVPGKFENIKLKPGQKSYVY